MSRNIQHAPRRRLMLPLWVPIILICLLLPPAVAMVVTIAI